MIYSAQAHASWHGRTQEDHQALLQLRLAQGFMPISLSMYADGVVGRPAGVLRFAGVMVRSAGAVGVTVLTAKTVPELLLLVGPLIAKGSAAYLITATGPADNPLYSVALRRAAEHSVVELNLSVKAFRQANLDQHAAGRILVSADAFGTSDDTRYCAVWARSDGRVAWNSQAMDDGAAAFQQRREAMAVYRARPALVARTPSGGHLGVFVDTRLVPGPGRLPEILPVRPTGLPAVGGPVGWEMRLDLTEAEFDVVSAGMAAHGLFPACIAGGAGVGSARLSAIWAHGDELRPRRFRGAGKGPAVPDVDAAMRAYLEANNCRGGALAIVSAGKLVYARGYTNAEDDYPPVTETTLFRQASISKVFTAMAIWRLIDTGKLTLDTTMQSVLNLMDGKQPAKVSATFGNLDQVTVQHLLESRSGIDQETVRRVATAAKNAGRTLPTNAWEVAALIARDGLVGKAGDPLNTVYGNTDYMLLGLIAATKTRGTTGPVDGSDGVYEAIEQLVLAPMGLSMTKAGRTLLGDQPQHSAHHMVCNYHPDADTPANSAEPLHTVASVKFADRPIAAQPYGGTDYEAEMGFGGLTASVVDVARMTAMFGCRGNNPLLPPDRLDEMLLRGAEARLRGYNHGTAPGLVPAHGCFHGFNTVEWHDVPSRSIRVEKGGMLAAVGTMTTGFAEGFLWVMALCGDYNPANNPNWLAWVQPPGVAFAAVAWDGTDSFPAYGFPTLAMERPAGSPPAAFSDDTIQARLTAAGMGVVPMG